MRRLLAISLVLLAACGQEPAGKPVMRTEIGSGKAEVQTSETPEAALPKAVSACEKVTFEQVALTHCVADPAIHRITTALGPKGAKPWRSLTDLAASRSADAPSVVFAMNAGMFDGEGKPIGYYVENGDRRKELNRAEGPGNFHMMPNGVFYGTGSKWSVRTADDFYRNVGDRPDFGTQSGPMLLIEGKLHPEIADDGPSRAIRNAVGVDAQGRAHFVISDAPLSFGKLARYFRDVLKTQNALFLDGNVSQLWDPASGRLDSGVPIGPMLVIEEKGN